MFLSEDSFRLRSQAYSYFADGFSDAIKGRGRFTVWVPDDQGDGDPSANDIAKGETMSGHFVTIPHVERYTGLQLNEVAESLGSFNFIRIEDAATDPSTPGVVYFADTGASPTTENRYGRIYKLTLDPADPRQAVLEVVLDNGAGDDIVNPDGLGLNDQALVIQEDRNKASTGVARIHVYDLGSETLTAVAALDPSDAAIAKGWRPRRLGVERRGRRERLLRPRHVARQRAGAQDEDPPTRPRPQGGLRRGRTRPAPAGEDPGDVERTSPLGSELRSRLPSESSLLRGVSNRRSPMFAACDPEYAFRDQASLLESVVERLMSVGDGAVAWRHFRRYLSGTTQFLSCSERGIVKLSWL